MTNSERDAIHLEADLAEAVIRKVIAEYRHHPSNPWPAGLGILYRAQYHINRVRMELLYAFERARF